MRLRVVFLVYTVFFFTSVFGQYTMGTTGLLNIPSADMQKEGTFMFGGNFLPKDLTPDEWNYNTGNYFINLTFLPFVELGYRMTLFKGNFKDGQKWQQDRSVSVRLRPLKEGKYWPSIVVGSNDLFTTNSLNPLKPTSGNRYFSSMYGVATKHILWGENDFGLTIGGYIPFYKMVEYKGVFGGISFSPSFYRPLSVIVEYDTKGLNVGLTVDLAKCINLYTFCYNMKTISGGIRLHFTADMLAKAKPLVPFEGRAQVVVYPQLSLVNSWLDKLYGVSVNLAPALQVKLWKGGEFRGQVIFPLWTNLDGPSEYIRAGVITLSHEMEILSGFHGRLTVGNFTNYRMGADLRLRYILPNGRWMWGIRGGLTGASTFNHGKWQLSKWKRVSAEVMTKFNIPSWNMDIKLAGHRFLFGDYGARIDCRRRFGQTIAGVYAMIAGGKANGGFHFAVRLPQWWSKKKFRIALPDYYQMEYSAQTGNEYFKRRLGETYQTHPGEGGSVDYDGAWMLTD